jgi:chromosomal replication initiator protein
MIAERSPGNVRELEGLFNQVVAKSHLGQEALGFTVSEMTLGEHDLLSRSIALHQVLEATAEQYGVTVRELAGPRRAQRLNQARQVAMYLARELTDVSLLQIGEAFGGRSHTTVLHGCNKVRSDLRPCVVV